MVDSFVVNEIWPEVAALRQLLTKREPATSIEALFINDDGDWRLVVALTGIDQTGVRPVFAALDVLAREENVDVSLLPRLFFVDLYNEEAQSLRYGIVERGVPKRFELSSSLLPGYSGAILKRNDREDRNERIRRFEQEIQSSLADLEISTHAPGSFMERLPWQQPDFVIESPTGETILVEAIVTNHRNLRSRLREAAGLANISGVPLILVISFFDKGSVDLDSQFGVVPVFPIDWSEHGKEGLALAISDAELWYQQAGGKKA